MKLLYEQKLLCENLQSLPNHALSLLQHVRRDLILLDDFQTILVNIF